MEKEEVKTNQIELFKEDELPLTPQEQFLKENLYKHELKGVKI